MGDAIQDQGNLNAGPGILRRCTLTANARVIVIVMVIQGV